MYSNTGLSKTKLISVTACVSYNDYGRELNSFKQEINKLH